MVKRVERMVALSLVSSLALMPSARWYERTLSKVAGSVKLSEDQGVAERLVERKLLKACPSASAMCNAEA